MARTLIYVPMAHTSQELGEIAKKILGSDVSKRDSAAEEYWKFALRSVLQVLDPSRERPMLLFCEDWSTQAQLKRSAENVEERVSNFYGVLTFIAAMIKIGCVPQLTENAHDLKLADLALQKQLRLIRKPNVTKVPSMRKEIIENRDKAIAARLDRTVPENGIAILTMGAAHDVPAHLDSSWEINVVTTPGLASEVQEMSSVTGPLQWLKIYNR